jgi:hypothetical protein
LIETDRDFERYGGGTNERPKKHLGPLAGSAPELAPPVTAPAVSNHESFIAPPPPPVTIAQRSDVPKKPQKSFFSGKWLDLVLVGALIASVTYVAVTWKIKSTSTRTKAVVQSAPPAPQPFALITPESSPVPSATVAPNSSSSASETSPVQQPTPSASEETAPSSSLDQTPIPSPSPEIATTTPAPEQAPLARNGRTWQAWIGDFVREFISADELQDINTNIAFYAPNVDYFDNGQQDTAYIRRDVEDYNQRWPIRHGSVDGEVHVSEKVPDKEYSADYKLNFSAENTRRDFSRGKSSVHLDITIIDGMPRISGIKQTMIQRQKGKPGSTPTNNAPSKSHAYGIPIQGKPGFVRSPYAPSKGEIDIRRYRKGTQLKCPFTGKTFIAP